MPLTNKRIYAKYILIIKFDTNFLKTKNRTLLLGSDVSFVYPNILFTIFISVDFEIELSSDLS